MLVPPNRAARGRGGPTPEAVPVTTPADPAALARLQETFLASVLPRVLAHGHTFRKELPLADIQGALRRGEEPGPVTDWPM